MRKFCFDVRRSVESCFVVVRLLQKRHEIHFKHFTQVRLRKQVVHQQILHFLSAILKNKTFNIDVPIDNQLATMKFTKKAVGLLLNENELAPSIISERATLLVGIKISTPHFTSSKSKLSFNIMFWIKQQPQQENVYVGSTAGKFKKLQTKPKQPNIQTAFFPFY